MKPASNNRRSRSRGNNKRQSGGGRNSYDSNGPEGKVRGTAQQVYEKYQALARDASSSGDRITAEAFYQFAEHYYRIFNADNANNQARSDRSKQRSDHQNASGAPRPENEKSVDKAETPANSATDQHSGQQGGGNSETGQVADPASVEAEKPRKKTRARKPRVKEIEDVSADTASALPQTMLPDVKAVEIPIVETTDNPEQDTVSEDNEAVATKDAINA